MNNLWKRKGLSYVAKVSVYLLSGEKYVIERKLGFISYHLIRWYHGDQKLKKLAMDTKTLPRADEVVGFGIHKTIKK